MAGRAGSGAYGRVSWAGTGLLILYKEEQRGLRGGSSSEGITMSFESIAR